MSEWRVIVNDGEEQLDDSDGLYDVETVDSFNPFGDSATAWFDDLEGELFEIFNRGTKVEFEYTDEETTGFVRDFVGYVVNDFENDADGAEQLEVEAFTFDQFLRGAEVSESQEGKLISEALEDVITSDVPPVEWDATLVTVEDDIELTRSYEGKPVEDFLLDLRKKSGGEFPSVTEDLKFAWERPEIERTERDIDNTEWVTHDISEQGGDTKNQITVVFDSGDRAVTVDESGDQLQTQDNLGAPGPAQQAGDPLVLDDVTTLDDAIDAGERYLERRESTITGPVTTFGLNAAEPGNVIGVEIEPRGIDSDFRIAENRTRWRSETNELTVVQKKGADDDILLEQAERVRRAETRTRDLDVIPDRVTDTKPSALVSVTADAGGVTHDVSRFVNDGKNTLRDGLINETPVSSFEVAFSTTEDRPSRSDSDIADKVDTAIPNVTTDPQSVTYSADTSMDNIRTVGVFDADTGTLLAVARLDSPVDAPSVYLTLSLSDDENTPKSVWTNVGLNLARDILSDNAPDWPDSYAYGSGSSEPAVTQTALDMQHTTVDLDEVLIQDANTTSDFESITDIDTVTTPLEVASGAVSAQQSSFTVEAEDFDREVGDSLFADDPDYSGGEAIVFSSNEVYREWDFTLAYDIPEGEFELWNRNDGDETDGNVPDVQWSIDGEVIGTTNNVLSLGWKEVFDITGTTAPALEAGEHTIRAENALNGSGGARIVDVVAPLDGRYSYTFDNDVGTSDYLDGPELFPEVVEVSFSKATTRRNVTEAQFESAWNDVSNSQYVELANDGETFTRVDNADTGSVTFAGANRGVDVNIGISRFGSRDTATPRFGFNGQEIESWQLFANPDAVTQEDIGTANTRAIVESDASLGETFAEAALLGESGDALTRSLIPEFDKQEQLIVSSERLRWRND